MRTPLIALTGLFCLTACSDNGFLFRSVGSYQSQAAQSMYLVEKPYEIDGVTYTPAEDDNYFDSGDAFWFSPDANRPLTANGEVVRSGEMTAMHRTLPLPCIVRVTNLNNQKSALLRVNDRGPFDNSRIMDVSETAANYLGFSKTHVTPIQIEIMAKESRALKRSLTSQITVQQPTVVKQTRSVPTGRGETALNPDAILYPGMTDSQISNLKLNQKNNQINQQNIQKSSSVNVVNAPAAWQAAKPVKQAAKTPVKQSQKVVSDVLYNGSGVSGFYVQIGAFSQDSSVAAIQRKLAHLPDLAVHKKMKNGKLLQHVRVGPFKTQSEASNMLDKVRGAGYADAIVMYE